MALLQNKVFIIFMTLVAGLGLFLLLVLAFGVVLGVGLGILVIWIIGYYLTQFLIFPGAFRLWRHWWQASLETELANNFIDHLHELAYALEILEKSANLLHIKKNSKQLQESLDIFKVLLNSYNQISDRDLSSDQILFKSKLVLIMKKMSETKLIFPNKSEDIMSVFGHSNDFDWSNVTFEDFPESLALKQIQELFTDLESFVVKFTEIRFPKSFLNEGLFTNLNILRLILQTSVKCEQYWVSSGSTLIDCMIVKSEENLIDSPVVIYCNPNGGLYEYACYQNNWLEFYISAGVDFCMFNYRGYGRTKGTVTSAKMNEDVQAIYDFLNKSKMYSKIAVHGESIGVAPACNLAKSSEVAFLFADRGFSSLDSVIYSHLGSAGKMFKCFSRWSDSTCLKYFIAPCYKVLSFDCNDEIVPESSSLKAGISNSIDCEELDKESLKDLLISITSIRNCVEALQNHEILSTKRSKSTLTSTSKSLSNPEEDLISSFAFKIFKCLELDSCGQALYEVNSLSSLSLWIRGLQIWGSFLPIGSNPIGKEKAHQRVKATISVLNDLFQENEFNVNVTIVHLCRQAKLLKNALSKILRFLETFNRPATEEYSFRDEDNNVGLAGALVPINCGHNGKYSNEEKSILTYHLRQARVIN